MIIKVKIEDFNRVMEILDKENIERDTFTNEYSAVCAEEIDNTLSSILEERKIELDDKTVSKLVYELSNELYTSNESNDAFQLLTETSELIINRALCERNYN